MLRIKVDAKTLIWAQMKLREAPQKVNVAIMRAVNETVKELETATKRKIRTKINIKASPLNHLADNGFIERRFATPPHLQGEVTMAVDKRIPLRYFGAKQTKTGVNYKIEKAGPRKSIPGAFGPGVQRLGSNVFVRAYSKQMGPFRKRKRRKGQGTKTVKMFPRVGRKPLVKVLGPSLHRLVTVHRMDDQLRFDGQAIFRKNLAQNINYQILKLEGKIQRKGK